MAKLSLIYHSTQITKNDILTKKNKVSSLLFKIRKKNKLQYFVQGKFFNNKSRNYLGPYHNKIVKTKNEGQRLIVVLEKYCKYTAKFFETQKHRKNEIWNSWCKICVCFVKKVWINEWEKRFKLSKRKIIRFSFLYCWHWILFYVFCVRARTSKYICF